jgi:cell wall-associated NlpC family hydrolase
MTDRNRTARSRIVRLTLAVAFVLPALVALPSTGSAAPSRADIDAAKQKLAALNDRESLLDEQYNQARLALARTQSRLTDAQAAASHARDEAVRAKRFLGTRVKAAYEGAGSQIGILLGSGTVGDLSDRLEYIGQIASDDQAALTRSRVAGQRARWAGQALTRAVHEKQAALSAVEGKRSALQRAVSDQQALISRLERELKHAQFLAAMRAAQLAAARPPASSGSSEAPPAPGPVPPPPPPNLTGAAAAIAAAKSVLGVPYVYAGASPSSGFDCSGLTMWSWAHAGVSLPHSSAAQYASLPHVDKSQLQPGDLLFFYSPIHHVAMYLGGGSMIHAPHTGDVVSIVPVYWQYFVGAARP